MTLRIPIQVRRHSTNNGRRHGCARDLEGLLYNIEAQDVMSKPGARNPSTRPAQIAGLAQGSSLDAQKGRKQLGPSGARNPAQTPCGTSPRRGGRGSAGPSTPFAEQEMPTPPTRGGVAVSVPGTGTDDVANNSVVGNWWILKVIPL